MALSRPQMAAVVVLRVLIGWHFLYEGLSKLTTPGWSASGYLLQSRGPFAALFRGMAADPSVLGVSSSAALGHRHCARTPQSA